MFELHSHTICSGGDLSPTALVQRAHRNGVSISLFLDFDFMGLFNFGLMNTQKNLFLECIWLFCSWVIVIISLLVLFKLVVG